MLTAEQEKTLIELGFKLTDVGYYYQKRYRVKGVITINRYVSFITGKHNYIAYKVNTCKEAKHDLAILREKGIV